MANLTRIKPLWEDPPAGAAPPDSGSPAAGALGLSYGPYLHDRSLGLGFPARWEVEAAASSLVSALPCLDRGCTERPLAYRVEISPGTIRLRAGLQDGYEEAGSIGPAGLRGESGFLDTARERIEALEAEDQAEGQPARGVISEWSARSRRTMIRTLAALDWEGVLFDPRTALAMVTLTYPGDWRSVCPDGRTLKRHLRAFWAAMTRHLDPYLPTLSDGGRALVAVWKVEFQRRGAPHLHIELPCPVVPLTVRLGRGDVASREARTLTFQHLVSEVWAGIVGAQGDERTRHVAAGTGVDFAEGARHSDPRRLAEYFLGHSATGGSKEYQHRVPPDFDGVGRFWGVKGLKPVRAEAPVARDQYLEARRLLRRWSTVGVHQGVADGREFRRPFVRTVRVKVPRVDTSTGEVRWRWVRRRRRLLDGGTVTVMDGRRARSVIPGGWVLATNAPALAADLARWLASEHDEGPPDGQGPMG